MKKEGKLLVQEKLGLKENWKQFSLLVLVNAFVGGMLGMERSIFPEYASSIFGIASHLSMLAFIIVFGLSKAVANLFTGKLLVKIGRKNTLLIGWLFALPVPFILIFAKDWNHVLLANLLLGFNQGLTWSSTLLMKIDLVGEKNRGFAMGLNEFAGYISIGLVAWISSKIAFSYGITPYPFYIGIVISWIGLLLSFIWIKDTVHFTTKEQTTAQQEYLTNVFVATSFTHKSLRTITLAGLVNNLNDGMIWGLLPIYLTSLSFAYKDIGTLVAIYPMVWGFSQLFTGKLADHYPKKRLMSLGMLLQGLAIIALPYEHSFYLLGAISALLGFGTALVYPTFLTSIATIIHPTQRAVGMATFRFWRDLGYAFGAILSGITADYLGVPNSILMIGVITLLTAWVIEKQHFLIK